MHRGSKRSAACGFRRQVLVAAIGFAALTASSVGRAGNGERGTQAERAACTPDVFRLCSSEIPDADRIVACLKVNTLELSEPCRAVMSGRDRPKGAGIKER